MPEHDDIFSAFKDTTMSTDLHPLPPGEVRRRGDRRRRRTTALAATGAVAAVALAVGLPLALVSGQDRADTVGPAAPGSTSPSGYVAWRDNVPADFPLTEGMPAGSREEAAYEPQAPGPCAGPAWAPDRALDTVAAVHTDPSEGGSERVLSLFTDEAEAVAALDGFTRQVTGCSDDRVQARVLASDLGEQSLVFVNAYDTGEGFLHQAVRVGNAVLYDTTYFNGAGSGFVVGQTQRLVATDSAYVVSAMCMFAADPCPEVPAR